MNTIKKLTAVAVVAGLAGLAQATTYWAAVYSGAYYNDTVKDTAAAANYSAYLCTKDAATTLFGGATSDAVINGDETHIGIADYAKWDTTFADMTSFSSVSYDALDQYAFLQYFTENTMPTGDYIAILTYANGSDHAVRVFTDKTSQTSTTLVFDDTTSGTAGSWTAVPEPTSALLMLFGLAGLALKRKQA